MFECKLNLNRSLQLIRIVMLALTLLRKFVCVKGIVCKTGGNTCNKSSSNKTGPACYFQGSNFRKL